MFFYHDFAVKMESLKEKETKTIHFRHQSVVACMTIIIGREEEVMKDVLTLFCGAFVYPVTDSWETIDKVIHKTGGEMNS